MRWTRKSKYCQDKSVWHDWFAWFPVFTEHYGGGGGKMVWLERIKRKGTYIGGHSAWYYKYKVIIDFPQYRKNYE